MQVYPASAGDRLGFTQVVEKLDSLLISEPGRDRLGNMRPAADVGWLRSELSRVEALQRVLRFDDPVPFEPMPDVRPQLGGLHRKMPTSIRCRCMKWGSSSVPHAGSTATLESERRRMRRYGRSCSSWCR